MPLSFSTLQTSHAIFVCTEISAAALQLYWKRGLQIPSWRRWTLRAWSAASPGEQLPPMRTLMRQMVRCQGYGTGKVSELELSLGKIIDTLRIDYPAWFERSPNLDIYDECVVFELDLGSALNTRPRSALRGKRAYCRALLGLQRLAQGTVRDGKVKCSIQHGSPCQYTLRVNWTCNGELAAIRCPVYISAISVYSVASEASANVPADIPAHRIDRHKIEFLEIHPPSLGRVLHGVWWQPQVQLAEPTLAMNSQHHCLQTHPELHWTGSQAGLF